LANKFQAEIMNKTCIQVSFFIQNEFTLCNATTVL